MSNKQRKKQNRLRISEQKLHHWYFSNLKSRRVQKYFLEHGNPMSNQWMNFLSEFTTRYAKPAYDALVQRIHEHKQEVKGLRK